MTDIYQIVKDEIIANIDNSIHVQSVLAAGSEYTLTVCATKWARVGLKITDESLTEFTITGVSSNQIVCTGVNPWNGHGQLQVYKFFIGTQMSTNKEWKEFDSDERKKVPFIWMVEPTKEEVQPRGSSVERISDLRLIFLDDNNVLSWQTTDTHEQRLYAIYQAVEYFVKAVKANRRFKRLEGFTVKNFTRLGKEMEEGFVANVIDANLTGVELRLSLPIYKASCRNCLVLIGN